MITHEKGLRAGVPVWFDQRKPPVRHQASTGDLSTEVLIIGAGISGALVAEHLTSHGFEVVLVDRREPLTGSTSASTALLQYELDLPLMKLSRMVGVKNAETIWRRSRLALEALAARSRRLGIEANLTRRDALYLSGDERDAKALAREADARCRAGFEVELVGSRELLDRYGIRRSAALLGFDDMCCDPRKLAAAVRMFRSAPSALFVACASRAAMASRLAQKPRARSNSGTSSHRSLRGHGRVDLARSAPDKLTVTRPTRVLLASLREIALDAQDDARAQHLEVRPAPQIANKLESSRHH